MARFLALKSIRPFRIKGLMGVVALTPSFLQAAPTTNAAPAAPQTPMASAPGTSPMTPNKPGAPAIPPEDPFNRYGKILAPGTEPAHPLKLALPFPDVAEIKVPTQDELTMREKLEQLATLTDAQIRAKLDQWPPFKTMSLKDEGMMLARIQDFRERRAKTAVEAARAIGLTLTPVQQARFEKEYWDKRLPMERDLAKQLEPILRQHEAKLQEELFREFSTPGMTLAQGAKPTPPAPGPPQNKPMPPVPPPPVVANKPATTPIAGPPPKPVTAPVPAPNSTPSKPMD